MKAQARLQAKRIEDESWKAREEYGYMENELTLQDWFWEAVRRTEDYRTSLEALRGYAQQRGECEYAALKGSVISLQTDYRNVMQFREVSVGKATNARYVFVPIGQESGYALPLPSARCVDLDENLGPSFNLFPMKCCDYSKFEALIHSFEAKTGKQGVTKEFISAAMDDLLIPIKKEHTILIGLDDRVMIDECEEYLLKEIKERLKQHKLRKRPDKWKWYFIVWDLVEQGYNPSQAGGIISNAFDKVFEDEEIREICRKANTFLTTDIGQAFLYYYAPGPRPWSAPFDMRAFMSALEDA
jgi:hypothetical protein